MAANITPAYAADLLIRMRSHIDEAKAHIVDAAAAGQIELDPRHSFGWGTVSFKLGFLADQIQGLETFADAPAVASLVRVQQALDEAERAALTPLGLYLDRLPEGHPALAA